MARFRRSASESRPEAFEEWPLLGSELLHPSVGQRVCMTCHWFGHEAGPNCIPYLVCRLHQGLVTQGDHLIWGCEGWVDQRQVDRRAA
jgi:hypothetical protein